MLQTSYQYKHMPEIRRCTSTWLQIEGGASNTVIEAADELLQVLGDEPFEVTTCNVYTFKPISLFCSFLANDALILFSKYLFVYA